MADLAVLLKEMEVVAKGFEELIQEMVFVGGATVPLYLDAPEKEEIRITEDIDVVVEIATYLDYTKLESALSEKGFQPDLESKVVVRKNYRGITVDVMPSEGRVWGFTNRWYPEGVRKSIWVGLPGGTRIRIFTVAYFLASKFEAHSKRAQNVDTSKDLEDIFLIFHGNSALESELSKNDKEVLLYLAEKARTFLELSELDFRELCDCYRVSSKRVREVLEFLSTLHGG